MASNLYQNGIKLILDRTIDLAADTLKVMLLSSSYTPNPDHIFVSDLSGELSGTGYVGGHAGSGRKTLASKVIGKDDSSNKAYFDAADVTWTAINAGTAAYAVVFKEGASDAASTVICNVDIADTVTNGGDLTIQWDSAGIFTISS